MIRQWPSHPSDLRTGRLEQLAREFFYLGLGQADFACIAEPAAGDGRQAVGIDLVVNFLERRGVFDFGD